MNVMAVVASNVRAAQYRYQCHYQQHSAYPKFNTFQAVMFTTSVIVILITGCWYGYLFMASDFFDLLLLLSSGCLAPAPKPSPPWRVSRGSADSSLPAWPQAGDSKQSLQLQFAVRI